ncbi:TIGR02147 family protein [Peredibacter starrii]|uniref:TIGR02147 family protein n=1 Tax=Peredibacter starrii TaxID=28202 RepID=A0AAX4HUN6_9BACT|nr:TIGR02147 family protein [Peredibacter starrii]WPU66798.1 TIGR02147 family protein [Peredibacter starrii]
MMQEDHLPNIAEYLNYREFLQDFYLSKKKVNASYSYRVFVNKGELGSPSHLKMVIDGSRNLTLSTIPKYVKAIGFKKKMETQLFELLVHYNQESDADQKITYFNEIMNLKRKQGLSMLEKHQFDLLAHWFHVAIYVLIDLYDFKDDPEWISERLRKKVTARQVRETLDSLETLKLIEKDDIKGYRQTSGALSTDEDIKSLGAYRYHQDMLELALDSLKNDSLDVREFNGVTMKISKDKLSVLKDKIRAFRKEINELTSNMEGTDQVYQLNIQLFPLTEVKQ